jgi:hypothetical protein
MGMPLEVRKGQTENERANGPSTPNLVKDMNINIQTGQAK